VDPQYVPYGPVYKAALNITNWDFGIFEMLFLPLDVHLNKSFSPCLDPKNRTIKLVQKTDSTSSTNWKVPMHSKITFYLENITQNASLKTASPKKITPNSKGVPMP